MESMNVIKQITQKCSDLTNKYLVMGDGVGSPVILNTYLSCTEEDVVNAIKKNKHVNINQKNPNGNTILMIVCMYSYAPGIATSMVEAFIAAGADPNIKNKYGETAMMLSITHSWTNKWQIIGTLLENGADPNIQDDEGNTCLMLILKYNSAFKYNIIRNLLKHGADPNLRNNLGKTALMYAIEHYKFKTLSNEKYIELLLDYGTDTTIKDNHGRTALDYLTNDKKIANMLINYQLAKENNRLLEENKKLREDFELIKNELLYIPGHDGFYEAMKNWNFKQEHNIS